MKIAANLKAKRKSAEESSMLKNGRKTQKENETATIQNDRETVMKIFTTSSEQEVVKEILFCNEFCNIPSFCHKSQPRMAWNHMVRIKSRALQKTVKRFNLMLI